MEINSEQSSKNTDAFMGWKEQLLVSDIASSLLDSLVNVLQDFSERNDNTLESMAFKHNGYEITITRYGSRPDRS